MRRRGYLRSVVAGSVLPLAGCVGRVRELVRPGPTLDAPATVPVDERFVVRVSGMNDPVWVEARTEDGAGHGIRLPWLPTWPNRPSGPFGGTVAGTARAAADAWPRAVSFFERGAGGVGRE